MWGSALARRFQKKEIRLAPGGEVGNGCRQQRFPDDLAKADVLLDKAETEEHARRQARRNAVP
jgi:hypothetical protein